MTVPAGAATGPAPARRSQYFRTVHPDDPAAAPMLADLEHEYDSRYGDHFGEPASVEIHRYPAEQFIAPRGTFILLYEDDELVAGGAFKPYADDAVELKRIWTARQHRGRGLAGVVVTELEEEARRRGFRRVYLTTGPRQPEAQRLYRKLGYTPLYDLTKPSEEVGIHPFEKYLNAAAAGNATTTAAPGASIEAAGRTALQRPVVPLRHPIRWIAAAVVVVLLLNLVQTLFTNPSWEWDRVGKWLFSPAILAGLRLTLVATALSAVISFAGGVIVAIARLSKNPVLSSLAWAYVWFFRSVPLILVLVILYNLRSLYPTIGLGIPFGPQFQVPTGSAMSDLTIGVLALSITEIAYTSEIVRAGLLAVDHGQHEAAQSLGLPRHRQFLRIVLPQALRSIVPAFVNQIIGLLKSSSLLFYVSLLDLFGVVQNLSSTYPTDIIPLLLTATLWYLALTSAVSIGQRYVERWTARGSIR